MLSVTRTQDAIAELFALCTRRGLARATRDYLAALPAHRALDGGIVLVHGGVRDVQQYMVGAGLIGQEVAATAHKLGAAVTLVEGAPLPLARALHPELAQWLVDLQRSQGVAVLLGQTVEALTARHRVGMIDLTFKHEIDWGLGFILDSRRHGPETIPYGYGHHASPRTFGHSGYRSSVGFADPAARAAIPDPNDPASFARSKLDILARCRSDLT